MTSLRVLPQALHPLPNAATTNSKASSVAAAAGSTPTAAGSFPTVLSATSEHAVPAPAPARVQAQPQQATSVLYESHIKAMIQQFLACRKMTFPAASKTNRAEPAASASSTAASDCEGVDDPSAEEHDLAPDVPFECARPFPAPFPAPLGPVHPSFVIWGPVDTIRLPLLSVSARPRRRPRSPSPRQRHPR
jgi:hypothetical protein